MLDLSKISAGQEKEIAQVSKISFWLPDRYIFCVWGKEKYTNLAIWLRETRVK